MPTQSDFQRIQDNVIKPLQRHYGMEFDTDLIDDYVSDLSKYSADTLKKAMSEIRADQKRRPVIGNIIAACRKYGEGERIPDSNALLPWRQKDEKAAKLTAEFMENYRLCDLMATAKDGGWANHLIQFVSALALMQACLISGMHAAPGCDCQTVSFAGITGNAYRGIITRCEQESRTQAAAGYICVDVPIELIDGWKVLKKAQPISQAPTAKTYSKTLRMPTEQEIAEMLGKKVA